MDKAQEFFVPIHGHIRLYPEEVAIVNHPSFQRLRRVRQLGLAHMVFPAATHTRFEHCIGAVHVAQTIIDHVNDNFRRNRASPGTGAWEYGGVNYPTARFIRLGALLHDIGHLPFGHTLEDELGHLRAHDGGARLSLVAETPSYQYEVDGELLGEIERPASGWSLEGLVNSLYHSLAQELNIGNQPFELLTHIVCKIPKSSDATFKKWTQTARLFEEFIDLDVCRDVVGNTICADFLDYLFRDWHHIGKPLYHDKRLYQYMEIRKEVRSRGSDDGTGEQPRFVIDVGPSEKIRHDALTDILELLNARYKLAETVLFHRTKLALTGLLDRCLLELRKLYTEVGIPEDDLKEMLEKLLLDSSDDGLVGVLKKLANGGSSTRKQRVQHALKSESESIEAQLGKSPKLYDNPEGNAAGGEIKAQLTLIQRLIQRLDGREVYTLAYKLRMSDFPGPHNPENPRVRRLLDLYAVPKNRLAFLSALEARCGLPAGSVVMYSPADARMNAKVAEVNLFIEGHVYPFHEYEKAQEDSGLTRGALLSQVKRFYELWSASIFVERTCWDRLSKPAQRNLQSVIRCFFYQMDITSDLKIARAQINASVKAVTAETTLSAFRASFGNPPAVEKPESFTFPSGLPFDIDS